MSLALFSYQYVRLCRAGTRSRRIAPVQNEQEPSNKRLPAAQQ